MNISASCEKMAFMFVSNIHVHVYMYITQYNSIHRVHTIKKPKVWRDITNTSPNKVFTSVASHSAKVLAKDRKRKATEVAKTRRRQNKYARTDNSTAARMAYSRHDDGITPDEVTEDISPESLEQFKNSFYETKVVVTREEARKIERETRIQQSEECSMERRKRITASKVGGIAKMKETTKRSSKVKALLYSSFRGNQATRYGTGMENVAIKQYITYIPA